MSKIDANILREADEATLTVTVEGDPRSPYMARDDHPNFKLMIAAIVAGDYEALPELFNVAETVTAQFQRLSERVTIEHGQVRFDGVAVDTTLTQHISDAVSEGADESTYTALVAFMEKVQTNEDERSREQLYEWINAQKGLTITEDGDMVGYKYVNVDDKHGYKSLTAGKEPVRVTLPDGTSNVYTGCIPNPVGGLVEMPRDLVDPNPLSLCSVGLHIGAWNYVKGSNTILEVHVNPRDVVAVPADHSGEKVRACRYTVIGPVTQKYGQAVKRDGEAPRPDVRNGETETTADLDLTLQPLRDKQDEETNLKRGDRVVFTEDYGRVREGDIGTITSVSPSRSYQGSSLLGVRMDCGNVSVFECRVAAAPEPEFAEGDRVMDADGYEGTVQSDLSVEYDEPSFVLVDDVTDPDFEFKVTDSSGRKHGKGGRTSQAAKGRGKHPAQDALGRFSAGRPGSVRDSKTGRFGG